MLNIDKLIGEPKVVTWGGKEYPAKEVTLAVVIKAQKVIDSNKSDEVLLRETSALVSELVPELDINKLPVRAIRPLFNYLMSDSEDAEKNSQTPEVATNPAEATETEETVK